MNKQDSNDEDLAKLLTEAEKDSEESNTPNKTTEYTESYDVEDKDIQDAEPEDIMS